MEDNPREEWLAHPYTQKYLRALEKRLEEDTKALTRNTRSATAPQLRYAGGFVHGLEAAILAARGKE